MYADGLVIQIKVVQVLKCGFAKNKRISKICTQPQRIFKFQMLIFAKKKSNANGLGTAALKMNARAAFSEVGM